MKVRLLTNNQQSLPFLAWIGGLLLMTQSLLGQVFVIDQKTSDGAMYSDDLSQASLAESFTPAFSAIGFVDFLLYDLQAGNGIGSKVFVNLRKDNVDGPIIGVSVTRDLPDGFSGPQRFIFETNITVQAETIYFLQPILASGDPCGLQYYHLGYNRGQIYTNGRPYPGNYWFREGIVEPQFTAPVVRNQLVTISWLGDGMLEQSTNLGGPWSQVAGNPTNTFQAAISGARLFFRVRR